MIDLLSFGLGFLTGFIFLVLLAYILINKIKIQEKYG